MKSENTWNIIDIIGLCLLIGFIPLLFIEAYIKENSNEKAEICGEVVKIYKKHESRRTYRYLDIQDKDKVLSFYLTNSDIKSWVSEHAKRSYIIFLASKEHDKICVTYSTKYNEGSIGWGGHKAPYVYRIVWSR